MGGGWEVEVRFRWVGGKAWGWVEIGCGNRVGVTRAGEGRRGCSTKVRSAALCPELTLSGCPPFSLVVGIGVGVGVGVGVEAGVGKGGGRGWVGAGREGVWGVKSTRSKCSPPRFVPT